MLTKRPSDPDPIDVPARAGLAARIVAARAPRCAGRVLLLTLGAIAALAHLPGLAPAAAAIALVSTVLAALWTAGRAAYVFVVAAQLVQLQPTASPVQLAAAGLVALVVVGVVALLRAMNAMVEQALHASLRTFGVRDDLMRQSRAQQAELSGQVAYWSSHDRLTQVLNRTAMNQQIASMAQSGTPCGILVMSLAGFAAVNEALGADTGDECLAALAARLRGRARDSDLVARLGGDDFAVVLPGLGLDHAAPVARRLLEVLDDPFTIGPHTLMLHARSGLAVDDGRFVDGPGDLVRRASVAARSAPIGAQPVVFNAVTQADHEAALVLEADLHQALARDELFLLYQPLVSTTTGQIESVEALVRWQHPVRGLVPPDQFIGAAERTGQIVGIGLRVLELAVAQLRQWKDGPASLVTVAVNVSARQVSEPGFAEQVQSVVWAAGVDPHRVVLELTESLLVEDSESAIAALWRLRSLGFRIALDDFGTGYSSLARLGELPLDELKIDKSFVDRLGAGSSDSTALVTAAIAMGHGLGLSVVAEGVETQLQAAHLTSLSCDLLQGYLLGKPMPAEAITAQIGQPLMAEPAAVPAPRAGAGEQPMSIPQLVPDAARR